MNNRSSQRTPVVPQPVASVASTHGSRFSIAWWLAVAALAGVSIGSVWALLALRDSENTGRAVTSGHLAFIRQRT